MNTGCHNPYCLNYHPDAGLPCLRCSDSLDQNIQRFKQKENPMIICDNRACPNYCPGHTGPCIQCRERDRQQMRKNRADYLKKELAILMSTPKEPQCIYCGSTDIAFDITHKGHYTVAFCSWECLHLLEDDDFLPRCRQCHEPATFNPDFCSHECEEHYYSDTNFCLYCNQPSSSDDPDFCSAYCQQAFDSQAYGVCN